MSTLKVNKLRDTAGSADAITLDPNGGAVLAGVTTISTARVTSGIVTNTFIVGAGVTISESGIEASGIGITCANINGTQIGGRRNIIINGAMMVSQRGQTFNSVATSQVTTDRFRWEQGGANNVAVFNVTQTSDAAREIGFENSLKAEVATVDDSLSSDHYSQFKYLIETNDIIRQSSYGLSTAKKMTLSFYVKSSVTGTFPLAFNNGNGSRSNPHVYTINSADTWERKVITFVGDTGGNWQTQGGNDGGFGIRWGLAVGAGYFGTADGAWAADSSYSNLYGSYSNSLVTTSGATWELTGVQLEIGEQATPFEHRSYQEEIQLCYRYYYKLQPAQGAYFGSGFWYNSNSFICHIDFPVVMRANLTAVETSGTASHYKVIANATTYTCSGVPSYLGDANNTSQSVNFTFSGSGTQGQGGLGRSGNASAYFAWNAEI